VRLGVLASGSSGNALALEHQGFTLLVDSGLSGRKHQTRLEACGMADSRPAAILVTHEHSDHVSGVGVVSRKWRIPVYASGGTLGASAHRMGRLTAPVVFDNGASMEIGPFRVSSFRLAHDAADPSGFIVEWEGGRLGIATDLGHPGPLVMESLSGCTALVLEFNHDEDMLWSGSYPWHLKQRIASSTGHLSNAVAAELLASVLHPGLRVCVLAHLSQENNLPSLAVEASRGVAGESVMIVAGMQDLALPVIEL
jgi:phosphoribosyl 1,2-cyclic phosphodiesterase